MVFFNRKIDITENQLLCRVEFANGSKVYYIKIEVILKITIFYRISYFRDKEVESNDKHYPM